MAAAASALLRRGSSRIPRLRRIVAPVPAADSIRAPAAGPSSPVPEDAAGRSPSSAPRPLRGIRSAAASASASPPTPPPPPPPPPLAPSPSPSPLRRSSTDAPDPFDRDVADPLLAGYDLTHPRCNVTPNIASRVGRNLHLRPGHPLRTVKAVVHDHFASLPGSRFRAYDDLSPVVPASLNFDSLLIPTDHASRSPSDTYYLDPDTVLRTHTSAHQTTILGRGVDQFLVTGDVYRRDEIDSSHYPVFHQTEGVRVFTPEEMHDAGVTTVEDGTRMAEEDLKSSLEGMARSLFGTDSEMRWVDEYFPFTDPSFELEVRFGDDWMEVLGCGVVHRDIVRGAGMGSRPGWAFGIGLERVAMILFGVPDIRLFWSEDERFLSQFRGGDVGVVFRPYSKYPPCYKDISFWTAAGGGGGLADGDDGAGEFHENDFYEVVRDVGGDLVERVELIDHFVQPGTGRASRCYRVSYRSMDRSLTNEEVDGLQERVREEAAGRLGVELR